MIKVPPRTDMASHKLLLFSATICAILSCQPALCQEKSLNGTNSMPVTLYGKADVMVSACEIVGLTLESKGMPTSVSYIRPLSEAARAGIQPRDRVLSANVEQDILYLTVVRRGNKKFGTGLRQEPILAETMQFELSDKAQPRIMKQPSPKADGQKKELTARKSPTKIGDENICFPEPSEQLVKQSPPSELPVNGIANPPVGDPLKAVPGDNLLKQISDAIQSKLFGRSVPGPGYSAEITPDPHHRDEKHSGKINPDPKRVEWRIGEEPKPDPHKKEDRKGNPPNPDPKKAKWHKYDEQPTPDPKDPKWHKYDEEPNPDPKTPNPRNRTHEKVPRVEKSPWSPTLPGSKPRIPREPGEPPVDPPANPTPPPPGEGAPWTSTPIDGGGGGSNPGSSNSGEGGPALACPATTAIEAAKSFPEGAWANDSTIPGGVFNHEKGKVTNPTSQTMIAPMKWPFDLPGFQTTGGTGAIKGIKEQMAEQHKKGEYTPTASDTADMVSRAASATTAALAQPNQWLQVAKETANVQTQQNADNSADMTKHEAGCALDFCRTSLENFTVNAGNKWNILRDRLFMPMAILLLLPGAIATQAKATVAQTFPLFGEVSPIEGIYRSIVAIFLIPGTYLIVNYGIDVSNSISYTICSEYSRIFGSDMYRDAMCAQIRAYPARLPAENLGYIPGQSGKMQGKGQGPRAKFEGKNLDVKLEDPCAGLYEAPMNKANEKVPYVVNAQRAGYNGMGAALAMTWNILCAFQMCYLYYLWFVGPVVAALWVYPVKQLREAFPNWCEGVVTICFWSLFWNTTILLMACCRGIDDTGTVIMSALNFLSTACVKFAFDFAGLVKAAGAEVGKMAEKAAAAGKGGGGKGGGGGSGSGKGGEKGAGAGKGGGGGGGAQGKNGAGRSHPHEPSVGAGGGGASVPSFEPPPGTGTGGSTVIAGAGGNSGTAAAGRGASPGSTGGSSPGIGGSGFGSGAGGSGSSFNSRSLAGLPKYASLDGTELGGFSSMSDASGFASSNGSSGGVGAGSSGTSPNRTSISRTSSNMGGSARTDAALPPGRGGGGAINPGAQPADEMPRIDQGNNQPSPTGQSVSGMDASGAGNQQGQRSSSPTYGRSSIPDNYSPISTNTNYTPVEPNRNYTPVSSGSYLRESVNPVNVEPVPPQKPAAASAPSSMPRSSVPDDFGLHDKGSALNDLRNSASNSISQTGHSQNYRNSAVELSESESGKKVTRDHSLRPGYGQQPPHAQSIDPPASKNSVQGPLTTNNNLDFFNNKHEMNQSGAEKGSRLGHLNHTQISSGIEDAPAFSKDNPSIGDCKANTESTADRRRPNNKSAGRRNLSSKKVDDEPTSAHLLPKLDISASSKQANLRRESGAPSEKNTDCTDDMHISAFFERLRQSCTAGGARPIKPMSEEEHTLMKKLAGIVDSAVTADANENEDDLCELTQKK